MSRADTPFTLSDGAEAHFAYGDYVHRTEDGGLVVVYAVPDEQTICGQPTEGMQVYTYYNKIPEAPLHKGCMTRALEIINAPT